MHFYGVAFDFLVPAVEFVFDLGAAVDVFGLREQHFEQNVFALGEGERLAGQLGGFGGGVELQPAVFDQRSGAALAAAHQCRQAGGNFVECEGFAQIIIGAAVEAGQAVGQGVAGGEYQHGRVVPLLPPAGENVHAVDVGQAEIEHHGIVRCVGKGVAAVFAVFQPIDGKAVFGEAVIEAVADVGVVFD